MRTIVRPSEDHEDHQKPVALGIESGCADLIVIGPQYPQKEEKINWVNKMQKYIRDEKMHRVREIQYNQEIKQKISCTDLTLTDALSKNKNEKKKKKEERERKGKKA